MKRSWLLVGVVASALSVVVYGCGTSSPPELNGGDSDASVQGPQPCSPEGATQSCHIPLGNHNGVIECFDGTQKCTNGFWGACGGPGGTRPAGQPPANDAGAPVPDPGTDAKRGLALAQSAEALALVPKMESYFARPTTKKAQTAKSARTRLVDAMFAPRPSQAIFAASTVQRFEAIDDYVKPVLASASTIRVTLPKTADGFALVADDKAGVGVRFRLVGAASSPAGVAGGVLVYRGALDGANVVHRPFAQGTEDFVVFEKKPQVEEIAYEVDVSRASGLRLVASTLELLDAKGTPRVRVAPPYAIDASGARIGATLSVDGCAFDSDPRAPWGRPIVAPRASTCTVRVAWHAAAYPVAVDPTWTTTGAMATAREGHTLSLLSTGLAVAAGGRSTPTGNGLASAELYDPSTGTWAATGSMTTGRAFHASASYGTGAGLVIAAGGITTNAAASATATAEIYDGGTGTWKTTGSLQQARFSPRATILTASSQTMYTGGFDATGTAIATVEIYDPINGVFVPTPTTMTATRVFHTAVELAGGTVLITGGTDSTGAALASAEIFDPGGLTFTTTAGTLPAPTTLQSAGRLANGQVLLVGGQDTSGNPTAAAILYDPATQAFTATGSLATARYKQTMRVLANGQAVVAGGYTAAGDTSATNTSEIFTPSAGTWANLGNMITARALGPAVLLSTEKILVAGGTNGANDLTASELLAGPGGSACLSNADCLSGLCNDGTCCQTNACTGACTTCLVGTGACVSVTGDVSDPDTCNAPNTCNALGQCVPAPTSCSNNPCDPSCIAPPNNSGPTNADAGITGQFTGTTDNLGGSPAGFVNKELCNPCTGPFPQTCGAFTHNNQFDACESDYHCNTATGQCVQNTQGWTWPAATCNGMDLTVEGTCTTTIPVCNRGNVDVPAGTIINVYHVDGNQWVAPCGCDPPATTSSTGSCTGTPTAPSCASETTSTACTGVLGCTWSSQCVGTATACNTLTTSATCTAETGCSWGCSGTANACSTYATSATCAGQTGCSWSCGGTANACSTFGTQATCSAQTGCGWTCGGAATACSLFTVANCPNQAGCTVGGSCSGTPTLTCSTLTGNAASCTSAGCTLSCRGTPGTCASHNGNPAQCTAAGCTCNNGACNTCSGTPRACSLNATSATCAAETGCTWDNCGGSPAACATETTNATCTAQTGCTWTPACTGTATACTSLSAAACGSQAGCSDRCTGNATACSSIAAASCANQVGCNVGCNGTATACSAVSIANCPSHGGCSVGCSGTASACSTMNTTNKCNGQAGCSWGTCIGTPSSCATITSQATCGTQAGCSWTAGACSGGQLTTNPTTPNSAGGCYQTLTQPLKAGTCIDVAGDTGHQCSWSGDTVAFAWLTDSSGNVIRECGGTNGPATTTGPQCYNNWADIKVGSNCVNYNTYGPQTVTDTYVSNCPGGTHVQWNLLNYNTTYTTNASGTSDVCFQAQTAPVLPDGGVGTFGALHNIADPPVLTGTAACPVATPACQGTAPQCNCQPPCVADLYTRLGGKPDATNEILKVTITVTPTPDTKGTGTMQSYQVSYSCPASE